MSDTQLELEPTSERVASLEASIADLREQVAQLANDLGRQIFGETSKMIWNDPEAPGEWFLVEKPNRQPSLDDEPDIGEPSIDDEPELGPAVQS